MHRLIVIIAFYTLAFSLALHPAWANERAYVTDTFQVTLRTGTSIQNKIIAMLSSGQPVEILESQGDWSLIRVLKPGSEKEGWIMNQYLIRRPPWETQAKTLKTENDQLRTKLPDIERQLRESTKREQALIKNLQDKTGNLEKLQLEYSSLKDEAADYLALKATYQKTRSELETIQDDIQRLTNENEELKASQRHKWFLTGALVLLCGLMIGLIIGKQQKRRQSSVYL